MKKSKKEHKMTMTELQAWLHYNRKAHAYSTKKDYKRNSKHRNKEFE